MQIPIIGEGNLANLFKKRQGCNQYQNMVPLLSTVQLALILLHNETNAGVSRMCPAVSQQINSLMVSDTQSPKVLIVDLTLVRVRN